MKYNKIASAATVVTMVATTWPMCRAVEGWHDIVRLQRRLGSLLSVALWAVVDPFLLPLKRCCQILWSIQQYSHFLMLWDKAKVEMVAVQCTSLRHTAINGIQL